MDPHIVAYLNALNSATLLQLVAMHELHNVENKRSKEPKTKRNGQPRKQRIANVSRNRSLANRTELQDMPDAFFAAGCRMSRDVFEQLLQQIIPLLQSKNRKRRLAKNYNKFDRHIDPYIALAFTLRWLAGGKWWDIAFGFKLARTTIHIWKWRIVRAINWVLRSNIQFPSDTPSLDSLAAGFSNIAGGLGAAIPNTVCAFDGVVVQKCPPAQEKLVPGGMVTTNSAAHFYRKGYFGAAMIAFVDAKCRFLSISHACAASCHDSTMYDCSYAGKLLDQGLPSKKYNAVADDAFTTRGHILTPYVGHSLTPQEDAFNYYLSLQRQVVERAFGIWKRKWGIFWQTLCVSEKHVKEVIEVTCRLHNFCIDRNVSSSIDDYIVHDERYWEAVKPDPIKHPRLNEMMTLSEPVLLDASERAQFFPASWTVGPQERTKRKVICDSIAAQGLLRPPPTPLPDPVLPLKRGSANLPFRLPDDNRF